MIDADLDVVAGAVERVAQLGQGLRPEGVVDLGPVDRDLRDPVALLVEQVAVLGRRLPRDRRVEGVLGRGVLVSNRHVRDYPSVSMFLDNWLAQRAETCPGPACGALAAASTSPTPSSSWRRRPPPGGSLPAACGAGTVVALALEPGPHYAVDPARADEARRGRLPAQHAARRARAAEELERAEPMLVLSSPLELTATEADMPLLGEHDLDAIHCRLLTSGTSGRARPIGLTYGNFLWSAVGSAFNLGVDPADRWLCCLPLYHVAGLSILMRSVIYGTGTVIHDGFDPERVARSLDEDGVTLVSLVTTQLVRLLEANVDLSGPRAIVVGGGPLPIDVIEEAAGRGATVVQTYGMTETCSQVTTLAPAEARTKVGLRRAAAPHDAPADPGRRDPRPGPDRRAGDRRRGRLAPHRRPRPDRRRGLPLRRGPARRHDRDRGRERPARPRSRRSCCATPTWPTPRRSAAPTSEWQEAVTAVVVVRDGADADAERLRAHCAVGARRASRSRSGSSSSPRCRGRHPASCCGGSCDRRRDGACGRSALARRLRRGLEVVRPRGDRGAVRRGRARTATTPTTSRSAAGTRSSLRGSARATGLARAATSPAPTTRRIRPFAVDGDVAVAVGTSTYTSPRDRRLRQLLPDALRRRRPLLGVHGVLHGATDRITCRADERHRTSSTTPTPTPTRSRARRSRSSASARRATPTRST